MTEREKPVTAARKVDFAKWDEIYDSARELLELCGSLKAPHTAAELRELLERYDEAKHRLADALAALEGHR